VQIVWVVTLSGIAMVGLTIMLVRAREAGGVNRRTQTMAGVAIGLMAAAVAAALTIDAVPDRFEWIVFLVIVMGVLGFALIVWRGRS
jgi:threonine/homoserine/homoserine lactone efflux protein